MIKIYDNVPIESGGIHKDLNEYDLAVKIDSAYKSYGKTRVLNSLNLSVPRGAM